MPGSGSTAPVFTVPAEAITMNGRKPFRRSAEIVSVSAWVSRRKCMSTGTLRTLSTGRPAMRAAL
jgi:hypothetical protein